MFEEDVRCAGIPLYAKGVKNEIWQSTNGGRCWKCVCDVGNSGFVLGFHFDQRRGSQSVFAATQKRIFVSNNRGACWSEMSLDGLPLAPKEDRDLFRSFSGASNADSLYLYVAIPNRCREDSKDCPSADCESNKQVGLYRRINDGKWEAMGTGGLDAALQSKGPKEDWHCSFLQFHHVLAVDVKPPIVYAFNANTGYYDTKRHCAVYRSQNGGDTWEATFNPIPFGEDERNVDLNWASVITKEEKLEPPAGVAVSPCDPNRLVITGTRCFVHDRNRWRCADSPPPECTIPSLQTGWNCNGFVVTAV